MASKKAKAENKNEKTVDVSLSETAKAAQASTPASIPKEESKASDGSKGKKAPKAKAPKKPPKPKIENQRVAYVVRLSKTALRGHEDVMKSVGLVVEGFLQGKVKEQEAVETINTLVQEAVSS